MPQHAFDELEEGLDWADAVVFAGFLLHSCNLLGPAQLRSVLMSARDQADRVLLLAPLERELSQGSASAPTYCEEFRPAWWGQAVTHIVRDHDGEGKGAS